MAEQPLIDAHLMKMMMTAKLADLLAIAVRAEADAALPVVFASELMPGQGRPEHESFAVLLQHLVGDPAFEIALHEVVKKQDAKYPMHSDADEVEEAMSPDLVGEGRLLGVEAEDANNQGHGSEPAIVDQKQGFLDAEGVGVNVQQSSRNQLRCWLVAGLDEKPPRPYPEIWPWNGTKDPGYAQRPEDDISRLLCRPKAQHQLPAVEHQEAAANNAELNSPLHDDRRLVREQRKHLCHGSLLIVHHFSKRELFSHVPETDEPPA